MCGIFCSLSRHGHVAPAPDLKRRLDSRGPDASRQLQMSCLTGTHREPTFLTYYCTVLSLRGCITVPQPLQCPGSSSTLCWNGEAWGISSEQPKNNDSAAVFDLIRGALEGRVSSPNPHTEAAANLQIISEAMSQIAGPYAFVFYHERCGKLYFGRDFLGRRSLLYRITVQGDVLLCSISDDAFGPDWMEVEADGIYCLDLFSDSLHSFTSETLTEHWGRFAVTKARYCFSETGGATPASVIPNLSLNRELSATVATLHAASSSVSALHELLRGSVAVRISDIPEPVAFVAESTSLSRSKMAVLFSGGLDCTTLARLSHELLPPSEPIDLLNVAFENPRIAKSGGNASYEGCPDRMTGRTSYAELCRICPSREWRFVEINVPYQEVMEHRPHVIALMRPHNTEMDLSIAYALYFAARGKGNASLNENPELKPYMTASRVLLSGLGADELFAGYTRHATAFRRAGHDGLLDELDLDIRRLGKRNLGRDDRIISSWSREVRFPFLDEELVAWALAAPIADKCDFGHQIDLQLDSTISSASLESDKKVLRCLAWRLGMKGTAREKKRAIQFGARTAKMETRKTRGTTLLS